LSALLIAVQINIKYFLSLGYKCGTIIYNTSE